MDTLSKNLSRPDVPVQLSVPDLPRANELNEVQKCKECKGCKCEKEHSISQHDPETAGLDDKQTNKR